MFYLHLDALIQVYSACENGYLLVIGNFLYICVTFKLFPGSRRNEERTKSLGSGSSVGFGITELAPLT